MNLDQGILFALFFAVFALLVWGRWRYDVIAFSALIVGVLLGVVPSGTAFDGFGHPAVVIIALVLVVSRGLAASGAVELITGALVDKDRSVSTHVGIMSTVSAALSAVMNNVAALALLMPVDMQAARRAKRSPALTLMPLSFASILGGMVTLIGTPPNIVIATFREGALGEPYRMLDFAPVGLAVSVAGVLFVALVGWRLIPVDRTKRDRAAELANLDDYIAEARVAESSSLVGTRVRDLDGQAEDSDINVLGLVRRGKRLPGYARREEIRADDLLVIEGAPAAIETFVGATGLEFLGAEASGGLLGAHLAMMEVVVPQDARLAGRSAYSLRLMSRYGTTLLGVSRQGKKFRDRVRHLEIQPGDVLLLVGRSEQLPDVARRLGLLPLAERGLEVAQRDKAWLAVGVFATAVLLASFGIVYLPIALAACVASYVGLGIVPLSRIYTAVEWPVIVLLASLIPLGGALEQSGGTQLIAQSIVDLTAGASPAIVLTVLMVITMTLSDLLNNVATALIAAPIGVQVAEQIGAHPDPFLMGVAVAASCAFLTPIGHKNNTLILGPGGYKFGDYWRMGLPLEILVIAVAVPTILWFWPI
ncbi:MAG: SLC13 family permease [Acidobacteria bacterium]|nr:SLC13 family permease [Acidobacteriota bacterium]